MGRDAKLFTADGLELRGQDGAPRRAGRGFDTGRGPAADGADAGVTGHRRAGVQDAKLGRTLRRRGSRLVFQRRRGGGAGRGG